MPTKKDPKSSKPRYGVTGMKADLEYIRENMVTKNEFLPVKNDTAKIRRDIDTVISFFDREYLGLRAKVERIERVLDLPPLEMELGFKEPPVQL